MLWHSPPRHAGGRDFFSDRPLRVWPAAALVVVAGTAGAVLCSVTRLAVPAAAPMLCGVVAIVAMFAVAFFEVHRRRWIDPVSLVKTVYVLGVLILGGLFARRAWLGLEPLPVGETGEGVGIVGLIAIVFGVPLLPTLLVLLAAGDRAPPPDESRLDAEPRL